MSTPSSLPICYAAEPTREREVALYIDGQYATRGPVSEAVAPARYGWRGWTEHVDPRRLTFELDQSSWGMDNPTKNDRPSLCWGGERLTAADFLAWYRSVAA